MCLVAKYIHNLLAFIRKLTKLSSKFVKNVKSDYSKQLMSCDCHVAHVTLLDILGARRKPNLVNCLLDARE